MTLWSRASARSVAPVLVRWLVLFAGLAVLYACSLAAFGGADKLWLFSRTEPHRYTAMGMITGTLRLRNGLSKLSGDEEVFNGAGYTTWGFGVPLLQVPFHLAAMKIRALKVAHFFPDRAIYFTYFAAAVPVIWAGFDRLLATRERLGASKLRRHVVSCATTLFVLTCAFYPLMSCRFIVYEETICYFMLAQFLALAAYVFALRNKGLWAVAGMAAAAGMGLVIRPTGVLYLGMWGVLFLLELRSRRTLLVFGATVTPFVAFWVITNWLRTGSPVSTGFENALPWFDYHTPMQRFGSVCTDTPAHALQAARRLFTALFELVTDDPKEWPWLSKCHFGFEERPPNATHNPFLGIGVFIALVWFVLHQLRRRESRLAMYVPAGMFVVLFCTFVWAGAGFAWRYAGDFWPVIVLAGVQYVRFLPSAAAPLFGFPLAVVFAISTRASFTREITPALSTLDTVGSAEDARMYGDFSNSRWAQDKSMPAKLTCQDHPDWPYHNGQGWKGGCAVGTFTNFYIGVPQKDDDHYVLTFQTEGMHTPTLRVRFNGRLYEVRNQEGRNPTDTYVADVNIHFARLASPIVMGTIEWVRVDNDPPAGVKLLSIRLE
jgi:hypothetical protein